MLMKNIKVMGFEGAIRGMRNPMNSWAKSDSIFSYNSSGEVVVLGDQDLKLINSLIKAGPEHRKFLRMIHIQFDINFPRYIWSEFDTYHFNTKNSCSTMHKLLSKDPITLDMFVYDKKDETLMSFIITKLEEIRVEYQETKNVELLKRAKQLLPEGFLQKRTIDTNYEELLTIYHQRKNHRLDEWKQFCKELENLPYFKMFIDMVGDK